MSMTSTNSRPRPRRRPAIRRVQGSDEALLLRYRDRADVAAFEELVHRYEKPIYNYLVRYLHDAALAEEVFQATFLKLHQKASQFHEGRRLRPWLYSIATHQAIDVLRKEGRHQTPSLDQDRATGEADAGRLLDLLQASTPTPPEIAQTHERAEWTRRAVAALPAHQRLAVLLIYFQGLKYREAAEVLGISDGTIKSRVHKALLSLNAAWQRDHPTHR